MSILTEQQVYKRSINKFRRDMSIEEELRLSRISQGSIVGNRPISTSEGKELEKFKTLAESHKTERENSAKEMHSKRGKRGYDEAVSRLARYKVEDGRAEEDIIEIINGTPTVTGVIHGVDPVTPYMLTRNTYDASGSVTGTETYVNPLIQKDQDERAIATTVVTIYAA